MKNYPFLKNLFLALAFLIIFPVPVIASDGYWRRGYWCSQENNYCRETWRTRYNGGWGNQNYYDNQPMLESVEYNDRIIITGVRPGIKICPLVIQILGHCDGYIGFDESRRTHIFRNYSHQQNNQWGNRQYYRDRIYPAPTWNRGGCVYQNKHVRILCN